MASCRVHLFIGPHKPTLFWLWCICHLTPRVRIPSVHGRLGLSLVVVRRGTRCSWIRSTIRVLWHLTFVRIYRLSPTCFVIWRGCTRKIGIWGNEIYDASHTNVLELCKKSLDWFCGADGPYLPSSVYTLQIIPSKLSTKEIQKKMRKVL